MSPGDLRSVWCPDCQAEPGFPCTVPTDNDRRVVRWVHLSRETSAALSSLTTEKEQR